MKEEKVTWPFILNFLFFLRAMILLLVAGLIVSVLLPIKAAAVKTDGGSSIRTVIPMGRAVGIKLFSDGVIVVGLSDLATSEGASSPAKNCGLKAGDIITHINSEEVDSIEEVQCIIRDAAGNKMSIRATRGDKQLQFTAQAVQCSTDGAYRLGALIRDSMAGIGTMTFYDPTTGLFGALGHGITDIDTAILIPLQSGAIMYATVSDIKKGECNTPGELHGTFQVNNDLGTLNANTNGGIFGILADKSLIGGAEPIPVAEPKEVNVGPATILSNISGNMVEEYSIEITKVCRGSEGENRDMMLKITDKRLLDSTGGIVQGMSGSPILQNGKLVGAVTHVLVSNPTQGYGIFAARMLDTAFSSMQ